MGEILRETGELLVGSFRKIVIPTAKGFWNWIIVGLLWLVIGGFASLPLVIWGGLYLHSQLGGVLLRAVMWIVVALVLWIYIHLWTASAMWFEKRFLSPSYQVSPVSWWVCVLLLLWFIGGLFWLIYIIPG